ncbi:MAG TPA: tetratricopeptide repeat protein, partial [Anaerolineaceae bacterium]|nr:tetratricopeptide repeat protein [Anaerolineaceae bacterium]
ISTDLDPEYGEAFLLLINAYIKEGELEKARETMEIAEELLADSPLLELAKGRLALSEGEFNRAIQFTQSALEKDLTLLAAYRLLGEIYQESNNARASLDPLLIYYRYNQTFDPHSEILLANAYAANNRYEDAIQQLDRYLERNPSYADGFLQRAIIFSQMEEFENALEDYTIAFKLEPRSFEKCILLSEAFFPINKPGNAYQQASECQKLANTDEELAHMYFVRALALEALKNPVAKRDWERMLELEPESIQPAWKSTAQSYLLNYYSPTPTVSLTPEPTRRTTTATTTTKTSTRTISPTFTITITPTR